jgi:hypothetical protein
MPAERDLLGAALRLVDSRLFALVTCGSRHVHNSENFGPLLDQSASHLIESNCSGRYRTMSAV